MKVSLFIVIMLLVEGVSASQSVLLGADFPWGAMFKSKFGAEICSDDSVNCQPIPSETQTVSLQNLKAALEANPDLIVNDSFVLRWGFFESTDCCGDSAKPWLSVDVKLVASEVKSNSIQTVYFPDGTYRSDLSCISASPVRKTNGLGLFYIGSQIFSMDRVISPKGAAGIATGSLGVTCLNDQR